MRRVTRSIVAVRLGGADLPLAQARRRETPTASGPRLKRRCGPAVSTWPRPACIKLEALRAPTPLDWLLRAQVATALGHDDLALESLRRVDLKHALAAQAALLAGRIERKQHRLRQAEASFRQGARARAGADRGPQGADLHLRHPASQAGSRRRVQGACPPHAAHASRPVHLGADALHRLGPRNLRRARGRDRSRPGRPAQPAGACDVAFRPIRCREPRSGDSRAAALRRSRRRGLASRAEPRARAH